jgi:hypothetical protein
MRQKDHKIRALPGLVVWCVACGYNVLMTEYILMGVMAATVLLLMMLRTNTAICFLALCSGSVLLSASGANLSLIATSLTSGVSTSTNIVQVFLLLTPLIVCAIALRKHMPKSLMLFALIPAICTAFLGAVFVVPLLSDGTQGAVASSETWKLLVQYQELIVGVGLVSSVVLLVMTIKKRH